MMRASFLKRFGQAYFNFTPTSNYPNVVEADGATEYWRFEEDTGNTAAATIGGPTFVQDTGGYTLNAPGAVGSGISFSGGSLIANGALPSSFNNRRWSVEFWIKLDIGADTRGWKAFGRTGRFDVNFENVRNRHMGVDIVRVIVRDQLSVEIPDDGEWHHIVYTYDADSGSEQLKAYLDGVVERFQNQNRDLPLTDSTGEVFLGATAGLGRRFAGSLDELSIYNGIALTPAQIIAHRDAR